MSDDSVLSVPYTAFSTAAPSTGIDYNGHLNDAAYAQVLTDANEMFLGALGLSAPYRQASGCSMYTVEITMKFLREVNADDVIRGESVVASCDAKRLRLDTTLLVGGDPVATGSSLYLHVDADAGRVVPFPKERAALLTSMVEVHDEESAPR